MTGPSAPRYQPRKSRDDVVMSVRIPSQVHERLKRVAEEHNTTVSEVIRVAIANEIGAA